ncbi:uncharacterized protein LOC123670653 [Harmonia axyridis]|uniref:uncharacterized protein LOC123670653 n=1 Tax=Harmonia axyridis TaxID=115357 RepID=UPI001E27893C|nr:uncharacterized protein LOC123670653 [Harmonia axyridis]
MESTKLQQSEISEKVNETDPASASNKNSGDTIIKKSKKKRSGPSKRKTKNEKSISLRVHLDLKLLEPLKLPEKLRKQIKKQMAEQAQTSRTESDKIKEENSSPQRVEELSHKLEEAKLKESS